VRDTTATADVSSPNPLRAVIYLRVSGQKQVKTDYDREGNSIPSQRAACTQRAKEIGAIILDEYVEPGRSAKELEKRDAFQEMRRRIISKRDVDYVIVYMFNRAFRNAADRAMVTREFRKAGARLIATNLALDDTPETELIEGILSYVDEYRIKSEGKDIAYKMGEKVKRGGSVGYAPLGYLNVTEEHEDSKVNTVKIDPERGPYITHIAELYATGRYSYADIRAIVTEQGLRTRPTKKHPAGTPLSINSIGKILSDRYYCGYVKHKGIEHKGRHTPLITEQLFERVQQVLATTGHSGIRRRVHPTPSKGFYGAPAAKNASSCHKTLATAVPISTCFAWAEKHTPAPCPTCASMDPTASSTPSATTTTPSPFPTQSDTN
jgi:site-specific DNA recombinase